jgi:uncharacterized SAM-binding protein YcdF (DUF218 family)
VTSDPLERADAIVIFGGGVPFRAMEAARIYHQGLAVRVWLTQGALHEDDLELARLGVDRTPEYVYSQEVLKKLGVPSAAIQILPQPVRNTAEEVRCIAQAAAAGHLGKVILVTSKYHARRVKILWHALTSGKVQAIVRYDSDPSDPQHWWRKTSDAMSVSRELFGIANAWAGFPMKTHN